MAPKNDEQTEKEKPEQEQQQEQQSPAQGETTVELTAEQLKDAGIDIPAEVPGEQAQGEDGQPKKKGKPEAQKRISQLTAKNAHLDNRAQELERQLGEERRKAAENAERATKAEAAAMTHYANSVKNGLEKAQRDLREAQALGDADKIVEATADVAKYASENASMEAWKAQQPKPEDRQRQQQQEQEKQRRAPPEPSQEVKTWIADNPWFNQRSSDFDPDMHDDAVAFAKKLERQWRREGRDEEIESEEYFSSITNHMKKLYPDNFDEPDEGRKTNGQIPAKRGLSDVPPVTRSGSPGQQRGPNGQMKVSLSSEEREFAHKLASTLKYPPGHARAGQSLSNQDAERQFALQKLQQQQRNA